MLLSKKCPLLFLLVFILSCSPKQENKTYERNIVEDISVILSADNTKDIANPAWIKSVSDGFLIYDAKLNEILKFNLEGQKLFSFGRQGNGPGEFLSVGGFWKFDQGFLIHDNKAQKLIRYDPSGNHIKDISLDFLDTPTLPVGIEALNFQEFVMPSGGEASSLLKVMDVTSQRAEYVGDVVSKKYVRKPTPDERRQAISLGNIPAMDENNVLLSSNESGIFSFQQTTATLEKYSQSGSLLWQKNLRIPEVEELFDYLFQENKSRLDSGKPLLQFAYAHGISANDEGVGVLLNVRGGQPVTIAWVPNNGNDLTVVTYKGLEHPSPIPLRFAISLDGSHILFGNTLEGKIYKANWPL
jgi:hypothetical protein